MALTLTQDDLDAIAALIPTAADNAAAVLAAAASAPISADVQEWRGAAPTTLTENAYVQVDVERWEAGSAAISQISGLASAMMDDMISFGPGGFKAFSEEALTNVPAAIGMAAADLDDQLAAIVEDTGTTLPATLAGLATAADLATVDGIVDDILEDTGTTLPGLLGGAGSTEYTDTVTDADSNPLDGVEVWITTDSAGAHTVASTTTDTLGAFAVYLDPGTYYLWLAKGGYNFPNPTTITVS